MHETCETIPYEYIERHQNGPLVRRWEQVLNTFDEIRTMLILLSNDSELPVLDRRVKDHVGRVYYVARGIGEALEFKIEQETSIPQDVALVILAIGALLHDEGKDNWNEDVLDLFATISKEQFEHYVKPHSLRSAEIISNIAQRNGIHDHWAVQEVIKIAIEHHLKWNSEKCGKVGYPENYGQQGFLASIVAVADSFDAMLFRPYSNKYLDLDACFQEILDCMDTGEFNDKLREAFIKWYHKVRSDLQEQCERIKILNEIELNKKIHTPLRELQRAA
jgi:response regulator RpfG family c-di-GMP phosphodiesterase